MIREFTITLLLLAGISGVLLWHYMSVDRQSYSSLFDQITVSTAFSSPVLSVKYYEPRVLFTEKAENPAYPQIPPIRSMDYVYEK